MTTNNRKRILNSNNITNIAKYSALAFQMFVIIAAGAFGGLQLDKLVKWRFPVFTFVLTVLAVILAIYQGVKDFIFLSRKKDKTKDS